MKARSKKILLTFFCFSLFWCSPTRADDIKRWDSSLDQKIKAAEEHEKKKQEQQQALDEKRYGEIIDKGWTHDITMAVMGRKIIIGMTKEQAVMSWGSPDKVNRSAYISGMHEQWIYERELYGKVYKRHFLYFENDILTSWQEM